MNLTLAEAMSNAQGYEERLERMQAQMELAQSRPDIDPCEVRRIYLAIQEAKMMLEEYYGYDERHGKWAYKDDGSREWVETACIHHNGIITKCANEAQRLKERMNLGKRFSDRTFSNFDKRRDPDAFNACSAYANDEDLFSKKCNSLIIFGSVGTGKTHLSASIANDFASKGIPTLFGTYIEHLEHIRNEFESAGANAHLNDMKKTMVLVIDDLGKEKRTEWTQQVLFDVINYRYEHLLPVIITTNFDVDGLANHVGAAIWSRLYEMSGSIVTSGTDYRQIGV